ncbi:MAG: hypothetical protein FWF60_05755 [Oscillospiraceae bacterium]|nr:hypothetical protein [Oscillospiraceae bacterium]
MQKEKKIRIPVWIRPSVNADVAGLFAGDNCRSPSEFIEKAVVFYCGFVRAERAEAYLSKVLTTTMRGMLDGFEDRQASLLFKLAVEMAMMLHVTAAANEVTPETLTRLRGRCVQEVKALHGRISFDEAARFQRDGG